MLFAVLVSSSPPGAFFCIPLLPTAASYQNVRWLVGVSLLKGDTGSLARLAFRFYILAFTADVLHHLLRLVLASSSSSTPDSDGSSCSSSFSSGSRSRGKGMAVGQKLLRAGTHPSARAAVRSGLLVVQGAQAGGLIAWPPAVISAVGLASALWDCYSFWPA